MLLCFFCESFDRVASDFYNNATTVQMLESAEECGSLRGYTIHCWGLPFLLFCGGGNQNRIATFRLQPYLSPNRSENCRFQWMPMPWLEAAR